jgi:hypothetical protein
MSAHAPQATVLVAYDRQAPLTFRFCLKEKV